LKKEYDLVVLGGGTGGYVAAIRAAQLGLKTAIVEAEKLGGTCLHKGCIPSKALLRSAEVYATVKQSEEFGIKIGHSELIFTEVQARKQRIVDQLHQGVQYLMNKGKIDVIEGYGRIMGASIFSPSSGCVSVEMKDGSENTILIPRFLLIATGSKPRTIDGWEVDGQQLLTSEEALVMEALPQSILIVGGGVIGIEWASMLSDFGVQVTVLEAADRILPGADKEVSTEMQRLLKKKKVKVATGVSLNKASLDKNDQHISVMATYKGKEETFTADKILLSVGRQPRVDGIGLENTEVKLKNEAIAVNHYYQTEEKHIYAIGDVIGGLQLAHVAAHEAIVAVEHMAGLNPEPLTYTQIAQCTYSRPEIAQVGLTEHEAIDKGFEVDTAKISFKAIGKALIQGESDGFIKLVKDKKTDDLLGIHMIGPQVTNLISEASLAMVLAASPWELSQVVHPHPSLSEIIGEAALAIEGTPINS
jgi:dihydrolipoamide dehydrogenase